MNWWSDAWGGTGQTCEAGEYIIMLVRRGRQRGEEKRGDGLENGHLLGQTVWSNTMWLVIIGIKGRKIWSQSPWSCAKKGFNERKSPENSSAVHTRHVKKVHSAWNRVYSAANEGFAVYKYKPQGRSSHNERQNGPVLLFTFTLHPIYLLKWKRSAQCIRS